MQWTPQSLAVNALHCRLYLRGLLASIDYQSEYKNRVEKILRSGPRIDGVLHRSCIRIDLVVQDSDEGARVATDEEGVSQGH